MKGLLYKESRCLWQYGKSYILMVVIFFALSMTNGTGSASGVMWLLYPVFLLASLPASLLNADEKDGWMMYCDTLPVTRRQIVTVKYIACAVLAAAVTLLAMAAAVLRGQTDPLYREQVVSVLPLMPMTGLAAPALMFPAMFKNGAVKGRTVFLTVEFQQRTLFTKYLSRKTLTSASDTITKTPTANGKKSLTPRTPITKTQRR